HIGRAALVRGVAFGLLADLGRCTLRLDPHLLDFGGCVRAQVGGLLLGERPDAPDPFTELGERRLGLALLLARRVGGGLQFLDTSGQLDRLTPGGVDSLGELPYAVVDLRRVVSASAYRP